MAEDQDKSESGISPEGYSTPSDDFQGRNLRSRFVQVQDLEEKILETRKSYESVLNCTPDAEKKTIEDLMNSALLSYQTELDNLDAEQSNPVATRNSPDEA
jgi:hypothetical protein